MKIEDFNNLSQNEMLKERVEQIIAVPEIEKKYRMSQIVLEYINAAFLTRIKKIEMKDYNIMRIAEKYREIDKELFEQMVKINAMYDTFDEEGITDEDDIEYLLFRIDCIYGIIRKKYRDIN